MQLPDDIFEYIWLVGWIGYFFFVYTPSARHYRRSQVAESRMKISDFVLDMLVFVCWQLISLLYIFTSWFGFADFTLPEWAGWTGVVIFLVALTLIQRAYTELGRNWTPTYQSVEGHALVTSGIYGYIRHPIYAGMLLWAIAQPLLLQNWLVGPLFLILFPPLFLMRLPREEQQLLDLFGEEYRSYMGRTGRIIPRLRRNDNI